MPRPLKDFEGFVGQSAAIAALCRLVAGAATLGRPLPNLFLVGPPGHGKTALVRALARALGAELREATASGGSADEVASLLGEVPPRGLLFFDEAHTLNPRVVATLNRVVDDSRPSERPEPASFTLLLATNRPGEVDRALRSRCCEIQLSDYTARELTVIARRVAAAEGVELTAQAARVLTTGADSPRTVANRVRQVALCYAGAAEITQPLVEEFLREVVGLDRHGLTPRHRRYLAALARHEGRPKTLRTLVADMGSDTGIVVAEVEPELVRRGLVELTDKGRVLSPAGWTVVRTPDEGGEG